jgi:hypothetical protein
VVETDTGKSLKPAQCPSCRPASAASSFRTSQSHPSAESRRPSGGRSRNEDSGTTLPVRAGGDHRVVAIARYEVGIGLERHLVVAAERECGAVPVETGHRRVGRVDDLEAKPGDHLDPVIIRRNRNRQDALDDGVVVVRHAVESGEGEIASHHDEAAALYEVGHHLAAVRSQWVE